MRKRRLWLIMGVFSAEGVLSITKWSWYGIIVIGISFMACSRGSNEKILFTSYLTNVQAVANAQASFVCCSKEQLKEMFLAYDLENLRSQLDRVNFQEAVVCLIKDYEVWDVVGKGNLGFIRVKPASKKGVCVAIFKKEDNRFYQFNERKEE